MKAFIHLYGEGDYFLIIQYLKTQTAASGDAAVCVGLRRRLYRPTQPSVFFPEL